MSVKLDLKDRKLLYELDINAKQTYSQLGKKVRLSKQLVKYRINKLEESGLIKGYFTMIDASKLGYITFRIYIKFRNINHEAKIEMIEYIKNKKAIFAVAQFSGRWDLCFLLNFRELFQFHEYWDDIQEKYLEFIHDYKICIYSQVYHFSKAYLIDQKDISPIRKTGGKIQESIDMTDFRILGKLAENARIPLIDISKEINLSPEAISRRIKQLQKKHIIIGYRALIDSPLLGITFYKVDFRLRTLKNLNKIIAYCHLDPTIFQINRTIGGESLEIEFQIKSLNDLHKKLEMMEKQFPDTFEFYEYYVILNELKVKYLPEE
ncbi:Lrp/AsnC family transcriptional regulator [Candidatus Woesearchaeota archaeon]|nr:Lrp/AsnC family transcriptional regulator [Candidatus Woesearchaeota archaeon]